jgi:hypothetical protein
MFDNIHKYIDEKKMFLGQSVHASVCTAFVAQVINKTDIVEIRLNSIRVADVIINGKTQDFSDVSWLRYKGRVRAQSVNVIPGKCVYHRLIIP